MGIHLTNSEFQEIIYHETKGEFTFLESYQGSWTKIWCRHNLCGNEFQIAPANLKRKKYPCPYCPHNEYTFKMDKTGHIDHLVTVRCPKMHRYKVLQHQLPLVAIGKIICPICKRLKVLDPLYRHAHVEFDFEFRGGHLA